MQPPAPGGVVTEGIRNRYVWAVVGGCVLLLFGAVYDPGVGQVPGVQPLSAAAWGLIRAYEPRAEGVLGVRRCLRASSEKRAMLG